jgi:hypothetical protein
MPPTGPTANCALEQLPHLARKLCDLWGKEEFEQEINQVIMDSRDGKRQGLPPDVLEELLFLGELTIAKRALYASESTGMPFREAFRQHLEKAQKFGVYKADENSDPWSNSRDREAGSAGRANPPPVKKVTAPVTRARTQKKKSWWRRLFG